jgi:hypothetical protein
MLRSAAKPRVSKHEAAPSFETRRCATLLRMRRIKPGNNANESPVHRDHFFFF